MVSTNDTMFFFAGYMLSTFQELTKYFQVKELLFFHIQSNEIFEMRCKHNSEVFQKNVCKFVVVFDLVKMGYQLDIEAIKYVKAMLSIDQNYYPERLHKLWIINAPWFFR